jgi:hypothetical protein
VMTNLLKMYFLPELHIRVHNSRYNSRDARLHFLGLTMVVFPTRRPTARESGDSSLRRRHGNFKSH